MVGEPAAGAAPLALVGEAVEAGQLVRVPVELGAEAPESARAVDRPLQPSGERRVCDGVRELGHVPPAVLRARLDPKPPVRIVDVVLIGVDRILVRRVVPDLAAGQVDPSAAVDWAPSRSC